ncbi:hypothetical protein HYPSUDRAFT_200061 [Hypholoma sublateritium FD-334 SS-4]|uniref:Uncharacterized protein n=1 Tax=Hypholoma sublateritium (strain FD-334 SS-4) TaxID=945553 RepID=A0A0D2Q0X7_HYPSF|nr:hypothetical protein HYPSUDRAFT_200061 [Hypholoma sublateritium FD-334 SS-4]
MQSPPSSPEYLDDPLYVIAQTPEGPIYTPEFMTLLEHMLDEANKKTELALQHSFHQQPQTFTHQIDVSYPSDGATSSASPSPLSWNNFVSYVPSAAASASALPLKKIRQSSKPRRQTTAKKNAVWLKADANRKEQERKLFCEHPKFPDCKQRCKTTSDLKRHMLSHEEPKCYCTIGICATNKKGYARIDSLRRHQKDQHTPQERAEHARSRGPAAPWGV